MSKPTRTPPTCEHCGSVLSAVTWTCVRGEHCPGASGSYASDGKCHNAEPGTFNHECGKPAVWIGTKPNGFRSGFCDRCRQDGYEARAFTRWHRIAPAKGR